MFSFNTISTRRFFIGFISVIIFFSFSNCSKFYVDQSINASADANEISTSRSLESLSTNSNLRYFGYFADGSEGVGTGNYIAETGRTANLHMIDGGGESFFKKIQLAKEKNSKVIISLYSFLFRVNGVRLQNEYLQNLVKLKSDLNARNLLDVIFGFYVVDEPYWNNSRQSNALSDQSVFSNLQTAARAIKQVFGPQAITLASEAYVPLQKPWLGFPAEYDWLAVNCYLAFGPICQTEESYRKLVNQFSQHLLPNQRLFLTLDNYWSSMPTPAVEKMLFERTLFQQNLALEYKAIALISFLYQNVPEGQLYGLISMNELRAHVERLAMSITGKSESSLNSNMIACEKNWPQIGNRWCEGTVEYQKICSCRPPGFADLNLWTLDQNGCYVHRSGSCFKANEICSDWQAAEVRTCRDGREYGRVSGCLPAGHNNPLLWVAESDGSFTHFTGRYCNLQNLPDCVDWQSVERKICIGEVEYGIVRGCKPQGFDDPSLWITETDGSFSHMTGRSCQTNLPTCENWSAVEVKFCVNGAQYGRVTGCLPEGYNNPSTWLRESENSFVHATGQSCE